MRWLFGFAAVLLILWCGWWFLASTTIEREARAWLGGGSAAQGLDTSYERFDVQGFPNRLDAVASGVIIREPASGNEITLPSLNVYAMSWKPWHIIADLPPSIEAKLSGQPVTLQSTGLRTSLRLQPSLDVPLADVRFRAEKIALESPLLGGMPARAATATLGLREGVLVPEGAVAGYDLGGEVTGIAVPEALLASLATIALPGLPKANLPSEITRLGLNAQLGLSAPIDRHLGATKPELETLELRELALVWGEMIVSASGKLRANAQGLAEGVIEVKVTNWQALPALLVASGKVNPRMGPLLFGMLNALARDAGDASVLTVPLMMARGTMNFGPLPLGASPRLRAAR